MDFKDLFPGIPDEEIEDAEERFTAYLDLIYEIAEKRRREGSLDEPGSSAYLEEVESTTSRNSHHA